MIEKSININSSFLFRLEIPIFITDLMWGLNNYYLTPKEIVNFAISNLENYDNDSYLELASLSNNELIDVEHILINTIVKLDYDETKAKDKWLYIILLWLFENRTHFEKPLNEVELIYSDFDYPSEIVSFVQYMPTEKPLFPTYQENINQLFQNWKEYLEQKKHILMTNS